VLVHADMDQSFLELEKAVHWDVGTLFGHIGNRTMPLSSEIEHELYQVEGVQRMTSLDGVLVLAQSLICLYC